MACLERRRQHVGRIDSEAGKHLRVRPGDPARSPLQAVSIRVLADRDQDLPDREFDPFQVDRISDRATGEFPVDETGGEIIERLAVRLMIVYVQWTPSS